MAKAEPDEPARYYHNARAGAYGQAADIVREDREGAVRRLRAMSKWWIDLTNMTPGSSFRPYHTTLAETYDHAAGIIAGSE